MHQWVGEGGFIEREQVSRRAKKDKKKRKERQPFIFLSPVELEIKEPLFPRVATQLPQLPFGQTPRHRCPAVSSLT